MSTAAWAIGDIPEGPDPSEAMSAMVQAGSTAAWKRAAEQASAVEPEAAHAAAEQALAEKEEAVAARDRAASEAEGLRRAGAADPDPGAF